MKGSRRTVGTGRGHRPWFGRPEAKKRRQGMPPIIKGTNASKVLASQPHHPLQSACGAVGIVYELPKKMGVFPMHPRVRLIAPSPKKQPNDDVRFNDWSSPSRQNEGCGQHPKKKRRSLAAMGRSAYQGHLVPTATTALPQPRA